MNTYQTIVVLFIALWIIMAIGVSIYADSKALPWFPILLSALFLGFALPLLLVALVPARVRPLPARTWNPDSAEYELEDDTESTREGSHA